MGSGATPISDGRGSSLPAAGRALDRARSEIVQGRYAEAEALLRSARAHIVAVLAVSPDNPAAYYELGVVLYDLGELLLATGRPAEALDVLWEAQDAYNSTGLGDEVVRYMADVRLRVARSWSALGIPVVAIRELQAAVVAWVTAARPDDDEDIFELARVLSLAAQLLLAHASTEVALAAAQAANSRWMHLINRGVLDRLSALSMDHVRVSLTSEVLALRSLGRDAELEGVVPAVQALFGEAYAADLVARRAEPPRPGLPDAIAACPHLPAAQSLARRLLTPRGPVVVPGFAVREADLLPAVGEVRLLVAALATTDPGLAQAAGLAGVCFAEIGLLVNAYAARGAHRVPIEGLAFDGSAPSTAALAEWFRLMIDLARLARCADSSADLIAYLNRADAVAEALRLSPTLDIAVRVEIDTALAELQD